MNLEREQEVDFMKHSTLALLCGEQWKAWAAGHEKEEGQALRAYQLAALFEQQAVILSAMHRNRTEWTRPAREQLAQPKATP